MVVLSWSSISRQFPPFVPAYCLLHRVHFRLTVIAGDVAQVAFRFAFIHSTEVRHKAGSSAEASACWVHWVSWVSRVVEHTQGCEMNCVMRPRPSLLVAGRLYKDMVWIAPR